MRVLFVTSEYAPLAKAGGLADVSAALPAALRDLHQAATALGLDAQDRQLAIDEGRELGALLGEEVGDEGAERLGIDLDLVVDGEVLLQLGAHVGGGARAPLAIARQGAGAEIDEIGRGVGADGGDERDLLHHAAHDLGAGPVRAFSEVIVPLTWPGIAAGVLLVFVPAIGMFAITDLMGGAKVPMIGNVIQNQFFKARNWPFGAALGVVFTMMFILAYALLQRRGARHSHS